MMKKLVTICLIAILGNGIMLAQTKSEKAEEKFTGSQIAWAKDRTQKLDAEVGLTQEQKEEILKINLKYAQEYSRMKDAGASDEKLDAYRDAKFEERVKSYGEVLTPEQKDKLKANHEKLKKDETTTDKEERKQELKEKAKDKDMNKEEMKDKKEEHDQKKDVEKKSE